MTDKTAPAFPTVMIGEIEGGMTLRDYFAAKALQGFLAYAAHKGIYIPPDDELATSTYQLADAMMKARNQ